jgi:hypothetical protein
VRRHPVSIRAWTVCCPGLPAAACGVCGATVSAVPAWGLAPRERSTLPVPTHRWPHVSLAPQRTGPSPAARPVASGGAAAPGRGPRPCAVASCLRHRPRADAWHRVGQHCARAYRRASRAGASGRGVCSPWPARSSAGGTRCRPYRPLGRDHVSLGPPRLFPPVSSAHTVGRWGGTMRLRLQRAGSTRPHRWPTGASWGCLPAMTTRWCSARPADSAARRAPCPPASCRRWLQVPRGWVRLSRVCPCRVLHPGRSPAGEA